MKSYLEQLKIIRSEIDGKKMFQFVPTPCEEHGIDCVEFKKLYDQRENFNAGITTASDVLKDKIEKLEVFLTK